MRDSAVPGTERAFRIDEFQRKRNALKQPVQSRRTESSPEIEDFGAPGRQFFQTGEASPDFLDRCAITRVGDLTDLDTVGIPVWFACRPNSRGLSVAQGKGLTHEQARISAVMEAVEGAVAERTGPLISCSASIAAMKSRGVSLVPIEQMQRCRSRQIDENVERSWVRGRGFYSVTDAYAPYELVGLDMRASPRWDHSSFLMSSIGLAAGVSIEQAAFHAVCELVENDATTMIDLFGVEKSASQEVDCSATAHVGLKRAIEAVERAGMRLRFLDVTGVIPVPVVACFVEAPFHGGRKPAVGLSAGFACRPHGADAALAALLEAVQSRLTKIAGSREDLSEESFASGYSRLPSHSGKAVAVDSLQMVAPSRDGQQSSSLAAVADTVRTHSAAEEIHIFPLLPDGGEFTVVRVLIAGLETVAEDGIVRLGSHAIRRILASKGTA